MLGTALRGLISGQGRLAIRVVPCAAHDMVRVIDGQVQVRVTAAAHDGAANDAVLALIAAALGVPRRAVRLAHGATGRIKLIAVALSPPGD